MAHDEYNRPYRDYYDRFRREEQEEQDKIHDLHMRTKAMERELQVRHSELSEYASANMTLKRTLEEMRESIKILEQALFLATRSTEMSAILKLQAEQSIAMLKKLEQ